MRPHSTDEGPELSDELKKKFREALNQPLKGPHCSEGPGSRGFVAVVDFMIEMMTDATGRMDVASQRMEDYIDVFNQLEERLMKARMEDEGR